MSQNYSRKAKQSEQRERRRPTEHIKSGLTAFQKALALVGSILSIIVASITINNYIHSDKSKNDDNSSSSTVIIQNNGEQEESATNSETGSNDDTASSSASNYQDGVLDPDSSSTNSSNETANSSTQTADTSTPDSQSGDDTENTAAQ